MSFWSELRRRHVFRTGIAYLASAWLVLQVADVVLANFGAPRWVAQALIVASALAFPIVLVLAWFYELTPEGVKSASEVRDAAPTEFLGRKADFVIIGVLVLSVGFLVVDNYVLDEPADSSVGTNTGPAIAVLPFTTIGDPENQYFSDGLSEEILNLLTEIPNLKVIGRTSSFAFRDRNADLPTIAAALGVTTLLEGSVSRDGDFVRIRTNLIDASDGSSIWSGRYDRELTDVFSVQDDVAAKIIDALDIIVGESPTRGRPTEYADAYALLLRAKTLLHAFELRDAELAVQQAITIDPNFSEAHELLAVVYWTQAGGIRSVQDAQRLMYEAAEKALAIDGDLVLARALEQAGDPATYSLSGEIAALERAALRRPDDPLILGALVFNLRRAGYVQEALAAAERLVDLDPLSAMARGRWLSALMAAGRTCDVLTNLEELDERLVPLNDWFVAEVNLTVGRDERAIASLESFFARQGSSAASSIRDLVIGARDPTTGEAHLDLYIPRLVASVPVENRLDVERRLPSLYFFFGFLDRYYETLFDYELLASAWTDADDFVDKGVVYPALGFTSAPQYLEVAESLGIVGVWETRRPPDYCTMVAGGWVCDSRSYQAPESCGSVRARTDDAGPLLRSYESMGSAVKVRIAR